MVTTMSGARDEVWISVQFPPREKSTIGNHRTTESVIDGFLLDTWPSWSPKARVGFCATRSLALISTRSIWSKQSFALLAKPAKMR